MKKFLSVLFFLTFVFSAFAADALDSEGYPQFYIRGQMTDNWSVRNEFRFSRVGDEFTLSLPSLDGEFKISGTEWLINFGAPENAKYAIDDAVSFMGKANAPNLIAQNLSDVTIRFKYKKDGSQREQTVIYISANGHDAPEYGTVVPGGELPVLHINVYKEGTREFDNEIIDRNLAHKNYFSGEYWLDVNGCEWLEELGAENVGSEAEPLPLEIKARGNYTRIGFSKKPFKLKLGKKQSLLGLTKSKHFAILAHADDTFGYLRNFTGFNLGRRIGLPWTPDQQAVEVYINGDYRGLYFLTESIRIDSDRVNITELDDMATAPEEVTGGYLVELDNYDEENQIRMEEKSCVGGFRDVLRITWDTPEEYSDIMKRFVTDQFTAMNEAVGANSDRLWSYLDLDDAARYYIVEEIMSHTEAYHGSTYLFRDRGENRKWHFSPLWDFGNAFNGPTNDFFYRHGPFGNTWIGSMRENAKFNDKVKATWMWFMNNGFDGIYDDIDEYVDHISRAAVRDRERWANAPRPDGVDFQGVADNSNMSHRKEKAVNHLKEKINWLKGMFGDYTAVTDATEPERDRTEAAPLPDYVRPVNVTDLEADAAGDIRYYTLEGLRVAKPQPGHIYIVVTPTETAKVRY